MTRFNRIARRSTRQRAQKGAALVIALILLLVATILGLAASRGTVLQERMSANTYDRSVAFQRAESALRAAEGAITADWRIANLGGIDCTTTSCPMVPENSFNDTDATWIDVGTVFNVNDEVSDNTPQYHIAFVGTGTGESNMGQSENAESTNYGAPGSGQVVAFYRVTARNADPNELGGRSIVVLQTTVRRPM